MKFLFQSLGFILLIAALKAIGGWAAFLSLLVSIYAIIHTFRYFHRRKREREQAPLLVQKADHRDDLAAKAMKRND